LIGAPRTELATAISTNPLVLRGVSPFISDLIMIYDSDLEEVDTVVHIINEDVAKILDT
jgi:hypothetical protein